MRVGSDRRLQHDPQSHVRATRHYWNDDGDVHLRFPLEIAERRAAVSLLGISGATGGICVDFLFHVVCHRRQTRHPRAHRHFGFCDRRAGVLSLAQNHKPLKFFNWLFDVLPTPFWVYAISIGAGASGLLPNDLPLYDQIVKHVLPLAICTMLLGVPVKDVVRMGRPALLELGLASATVFVAQILAYVALVHWLPDDAWKSVGALLGTWIGGSANMLAVKEILQLKADSLTPLIIVDTILSYTWMAILLASVRFQTRFVMTSPLVGEVGPPLAGRVGDFNNPEEKKERPLSVPPLAGHLPPQGGKATITAVIVAMAVGELSIFLGAQIKNFLPQLSANAWSLLLVSLLSVALSPWVAPLFKNPKIRKSGSWLLYTVLFAIGVRTNVHGSMGSSIFFVYGVLTFALHGFLLWHVGRWAKLPLSFLATASQANIGGAASAPIVAEAYQPGTGYLGVLMAVAGAVMGTYAGLVGAALCRFLRAPLLCRQTALTS